MLYVKVVDWSLEVESDVCTGRVPSLMASHVPPLDVIRPRYIAPPPPGIDTHVYSTAPPPLAVTPLAAPLPAHHFPPPGIPLGLPPLPRPPVQPPPVHGPPVLLPGMAHSAGAQATVMTATPPPTYPLAGSVVLVAHCVHRIEYKVIIIIIMLL